MENNQEIRIIRTAQFGELHIEKNHIFTFAHGLLGFDDLREFVLISEEETVPFKWLICIEKPEIGFPLLSPWHIDLSYDPGPDFNLDHEVLMVIVTLKDRGMMTANMKAPLVLDVTDQSGRQVILPTDRYYTDHVIPLQKNN